MRLDGELLESLRDLGGPAGPSFLKDLIDTYLADSGSLLAAIEAAAAEGDGPALFRAAHGLKGCCANLGAVQLAAACARLQAAAESGDAAAIRAGMAALRAEFHATGDALRAYRGP